MRRAFLFLLLPFSLCCAFCSTPPSQAHTTHANKKTPTRKNGDLSAGATQTNPRDGLIYVWIPPGKFTMGCSPDDGKCFESENPPHEVILTKGFWIGQTLVTQSAYQRVTKTGGGQAANQSKFPGDRQPVEMVTWDEAAAYCTAIDMRLPTEAEWEHAARAGSRAERYGSLDDIAWYLFNAGDTTHDVAGKHPNDWHLYDMLGNVWEWTADWWDQDYYSRRESQDPSGPRFGIFRVLRGGAVMSEERGVRVSNRSYRQPGSRDPFIGFRCAGNSLPIAKP